MHDDPLTHLGDLLIHSLYFHGAKISRLLFWRVTFLGETIQSILLIRELVHREYRHHPCRPKTSSKNRIFSKIRWVIVFFRRRAIETSFIDRKTEALCVTVERDDGNYRYMIRRPPLTQEISKSRSAWCGANHMPPIEKWGFLIIPATRLSTKPYILRTQMCVIENNFRNFGATASFETERPF